MNTHPDIWLAFARSLGMLFVVLGFFLLVFYLFRRFSGSVGAKGTKSLIQVLAVHHISPKEKLMLVNVLEENILIGITPQAITPLVQLGRKEGLPETVSKTGFSDLLKTTLSTASLGAFKQNGQKESGQKEKDQADGDTRA